MKKDIIDGPLFDYNIEFDIEHLPSVLKDVIKKLENYDKIDDWFNYDIEFDYLEILAKSFLRNQKITEQDYKMILRKYGGLYD